MPGWVAEVNKRVFNKLELKRGQRPVLTHVGRSTGRTYHTPLDAHAVEGGFVFVCVYGANSDWVQNILASGTATVRIGDETHELESPRVIGTDEALRQLDESVKAPPGFLNITECLRMDLAA